MAQHSNSDSSSGFGKLLTRTFIGLLSITATAVISSVVQRHLAPSAVPDSPAARPAVSPSGAGDSAGATDPEASPIDSSQTDGAVADSVPLDAQPSAATDALPSAAESPAAESPPVQEPSLREKLNKALRDKWNKN